jgi:hypothetical protein
MAVLNSRPKLRWYQYSLKTLMLLVGSTAFFFSVACTLGYVDAVIILAAVAALVVIALCPRRVYPETGVLIAITAVILLWANLRQTGWEWRCPIQRGWQGCDTSTPKEIDPITSAMFWRGWPMSPWRLYPSHQGYDGVDGTPLTAFYFVDHPSVQEALLIRGTLLLDCVVFFAALFTVRFICELYFRRFSAFRHKIKR